MKKLLIGEPTKRGDGTIAEEARGGRDGELIVTDLHGRYHELGRRGRVYAVSTAAAGTTVVSGNVSPPAAAAATVLTLYNPTGSRVELEILKVVLYHVSGTPGAGSWWHCLSNSAAITATENAAPVNSLNGARATAKGFTQTALTGGAVHVAYRAMGGSFAGAIAATTPGQVREEELAGEIVLPAGWAYTIAAPAAGTTHIVIASIVFAEHDAVS